MRNLIATCQLILLVVIVIQLMREVRGTQALTEVAQQQTSCGATVTILPTT